MVERFGAVSISAAEHTPKETQIMLIVFGLLILWALSMYFYLPLPIIVLLFAAVATGVTLTAWTAINNRRLANAVVERDTKY